MRSLALAAIAVACVAAAAAVVVRDPGNTAVATVDGVAITREAYDEYASVFTTPDGRLRISSEDVLLSLVNQVLVEREADRLGAIVSGDDVSGMIRDMQAELAPEVLTLPGNLDNAAFRERLRLFLLFRLVKQRVIEPYHAPIEVVRAEYASDASVHVLGFEEARSEIQARLGRADIERRWVEWLANRRACADIRVLDPAFELPSSTTEPGCDDGASR